MNEEPIERVDITNAAIQNPRWWNPWVQAIYIDLPNLLAFDIFERYNLRPFGFRKLDNEDIPYIGVYCYVRKSRLVDFFKCMVELRKLILMCGHNNYDDFCKQYINDDVGESAEVMDDRT